MSRCCRPVGVRWGRRASAPSRPQARKAQFQPVRRLLGAATMRIRLNAAVAVLSILPSWAATRGPRCTSATRIGLPSMCDDDSELPEGSGPASVNLTSELTAERREDGGVVVDVPARGELPGGSWTPISSRSRGPRRRSSMRTAPSRPTRRRPRAEELYWDGNKLVDAACVRPLRGSRRRAPSRSRALRDMDDDARFERRRDRASQGSDPRPRLGRSSASRRCSPRGPSRS